MGRHLAIRRSFVRRYHRLFGRCSGRDKDLVCYLPGRAELMDVNLRSLIGKFNDVTRSATEAAAGLCLSRTHYNVEIEHYLSKLLDSSDGDFAAIAKNAGIDKSRFAGELRRALDRLKTGNGRTPALGPDFVEMMTLAWTIGSIDFGAAQVRTGYTILAL